MKSWDEGTLIKDAWVAPGLFISVRFVGGNRVKKYGSLERGAVYSCGFSSARYAGRGQSTADLWPPGDDFIIQAVHPPRLRSPPPPHSRPTSSHRRAPLSTSRPNRTLKNTTFTLLLPDAYGIPLSHTFSHLENILPLTFVMSPALCAAAREPRLKSFISESV